ncbi:MAG: hypothetical protein AABW46_01565 [Nanoarchaeota archaeon]
MKLKNKRRVIIGLSGIGLILLYFARSLSSIAFLLVTIGVLFLFHYVDHVYKFDFPLKYYFYLFLIMVFGSIIGAGLPPFGFYYRWELYDKFLHFVSPVLLCSIVFFIINKLDITLKWKFLLTVSIVMGILALFELSEFAGDLLFDFKLQGVYIFDLINREKVESILNPHMDTMLDLGLGFLGCLSYVVYKWTHLALKR